MNNLESGIKNLKENEILNLSGEYLIEDFEDKKFIINGEVCNNLIIINKQNVTISGENAKITINIKHKLIEKLNLFYISEYSKNIIFKNLKINVHYLGAESDERIEVFCNNGYAVKMTDCFIEMTSKKQVSMVGVHNSGNSNSRLITSADNFVLQNSIITIRCAPERVENSNDVIGVLNEASNSGNFSGNFIYSFNKGVGINQRAIGFLNLASYTRIHNNNIKANGSHNEGVDKRQCYTYGIINEGDYAIASGNNIVAEWGGKCVGFKNKGRYSNITGNKILTTHTPMGTTVQIMGLNCLLANNSIFSTSANARLVSIINNNNSSVGNMLFGLKDAQLERYSCGFLVSDSQNVLIENNFIEGVVNCACLVSNSNVQVNNNKAVDIVEYSEDAAIFLKLYDEEK